MGNQHSAAHAALKPRKNVHWKSAGRPGPPGRPAIIPLDSDEEPNAITLQWASATHDGGAPLLGYQVECNRLGTAEWVRTAPAIVQRPELLLTGLQPPYRYQFRVAALNAVGRSDYSELSDILTISSDPHHQEPPIFLQHLEDVTALENDKTEFRVTFTALPNASIAWFKDDYEIFSSRRTAITTTDSSSVLIFHQTLPSDEGEIKCTATNRIGHAVTKAHLSLEAAPKLRYPRQYEDGLLYEINETIFLKTSIVGKPTPTIEWRHDGQPLIPSDRIEVTNTPKFSMLKIHSARRGDRGEYQIHAYNSIGEDTAAFLVTVTAPPDPPHRVTVARQLDKSVTLNWEPPDDDGGCRIGNYVVEYFRTGWNVWLKATTSRKTSVTLFDLIEGSEYRFRVKAESPYGMSAPSVESSPIRIPGRAVDMEFLAVESQIINKVLTKEDGAGEESRVSPAPRRKRTQSATTPQAALEPEAPPPTKRLMQPPPSRERANSSEFMLVLYPDNGKEADKADKRKSFQLDLEEALSPPPISFSAPELSARCVMPFKGLRNAVSSTELLHERAMARFYKAVAMEEKQSQLKQDRQNKYEANDIPLNEADDKQYDDDTSYLEQEIVTPTRAPQIIIKSDSIEKKEFNYNSRQTSQDSATSSNKWQSMSFDEDYTASTVSSDEEQYSEEGSTYEDEGRGQYTDDEGTYNPRDKMARPSPLKETIEAEEDTEDISEMDTSKPLPLPDPNFVPKPILKKRESNVVETQELNIKAIRPANKTLKPKKEEKLKIFKKLPKMSVQKPNFSFPKILSKKEPEKETETLSNNVSKPINKSKKDDEKINDEGRTVIEHYGNIVKEYGSQKKSTTPLYLKTEDLKTVAEKQQAERKVHVAKKKVVKIKKPLAAKTEENNPADKPVNKTKINTNNTTKKPAPKTQISTEKPKPVDMKKQVLNKTQENHTKENSTQKIVLKTTERATIVIPIDYKELEEKAKVNVRSAIDYMVDMCLLVLAFWVYFFKDERLAIPFLILIIYRQLQETFNTVFNIPEWIKSHTPTWLKRKTS